MWQEASESTSSTRRGLSHRRLAIRIKYDTLLQMAGLPPFCVLFFRSATGREPVRDWLKDLPADERRIIGEDLKTLQFRWPLGMPLVRSLGDGLWELRSRLPTRISRCLFYIRERRIILLHGFIKKTQKTPTEDKALALKRKNEHSQAE